jgi:hypothetical protein|tara:strand:+ start:13739 stop:13861 length:123 start_codon:yes stop_codon:yes gene_type:complete
VAAVVVEVEVVEAVDVAEDEVVVVIVTDPPMGQCQIVVPV